MPDDAVCCHAADASTLPPLLYNSPPNNRFGDTNKTNLNGSIITLTMKNNHLIVETEERVPVIINHARNFFTPIRAPLVYRRSDDQTDLTTGRDVSDRIIRYYKTTFNRKPIKTPPSQ